jgi:hypothetical protein
MPATGGNSETVSGSSRCRPFGAPIFAMSGREQRAAREARIERAESGDVVLIEQAIADAGETIRVAGGVSMMRE